jgi:two-component system cell cycle response regulator CtrA
MRILIADDDSSVIHAISLVLSRDQWVVETAESGQDAADLGRQEQYEAIILDVRFPDRSGIDVVREIRRSGRTTPILVISGLGEVEERIRALHAGADDFLPKPFNRQELRARLLTLIRRRHGHAAPVLDCGRLQIDLERRDVRVDGQDVGLSQREYQVLRALAMRANAVVDRDTLLDTLYPLEESPDIKVIDIFVHKVRRKLESVLQCESGIETSWGKGYMLRTSAPGTLKDRREAC